MSQGIFSSIVPTTTSGNQLAVILTDFKEAIVSGFSGTTRPSELDAGGYWIDMSDPNLWAYKMYTGVQDITIFTLNLSTGSSSISAADSFFEIAKISEDSLGSVLKLIKERASNNGQTLTNDILGEIQFQGTRDSGVNVTIARIKAISSDDTTSSAQGGYLVFEASADGDGSIQEMMRLVDRKLGIGTQSPEKELHVMGSIKAEMDSEDALGAEVLIKKSRIGGSGQVLSGDSLGKLEFLSTDGNGTEVEGVLVEVKATETHTTSAHGTSISIKNKKNGETAYTEQVFIGSTVEVKTDLTIAGNLTVNGTSITINTESLDVEDANITVNKGGTEATADANKAGITVEMSDATNAIIGFDSTKESKFVIGEVGSEREIAVRTIDTEANLTTFALTATNGQICFASDTKIMYQVVDGELVAVGSGSSVKSISFSIANNQTSEANITDLIIDPLVFKQFEIDCVIYRKTDSIEYAQTSKLTGVFKPIANKWFISEVFTGENAGVTFSIGNDGQLKYISSNITGTNYLGNLDYKIVQLFKV